WISPRRWRYILPPLSIITDPYAFGGLFHEQFRKYYSSSFSPTSLSSSLIVRYLYSPHFNPCQPLLPTVLDSKRTYRSFSFSRLLALYRWLFWPTIQPRAVAHSTSDCLVISPPSTNYMPFIASSISRLLKTGSGWLVPSSLV